MDALRIETLSALEHVICVAEDITACRIMQDTDKETLCIYDIDTGRKTVMNCRMNSVGATLRQVCMHINKRDLFSYEPDYVIES